MGSTDAQGKLIAWKVWAHRYLASRVLRLSLSVKQNKDRYAIGKKVTFFALVTAALLAAQAVRADDLKSVLQRLDAAAEGFQTTSAHVEFDTIQTDPIPDKDVMTGTAYYERNGNHFQMAAHLTEHNKRPTAKTYILSGGTLRVSDTGKESDAKAYTQAGKYESYLMLGFGASGTQLEEKWDDHLPGHRNDRWRKDR